MGADDIACWDVYEVDKACAPLSAYDLLLNVDGNIEKAKTEFALSTKGARFKSLIPMDVKPPFYKETVPAGLLNSLALKIKKPSP